MPATFRTHAGDWSIFGDSAAPALTAMSRWTGDHLPVLEKLASINRLVDKAPSLMMGGTKYQRRYPAEEINSAYQRILKADGHGGGPGTGWAGLSSRRELEHGNEVHFSRMREAHEEVSYLLAQEFEGLARQIQSDGPAVVVVNPLSWERTERCAGAREPRTAGERLPAGGRRELAGCSLAEAGRWKSNSSRRTCHPSAIVAIGWCLPRHRKRRFPQSLSPGRSSRAASIRSRWTKRGTLSASWIKSRPGSWSTPAVSSSLTG